MFSQAFVILSTGWGRGMYGMADCTLKSTTTGATSTSDVHGKGMGVCMVVGHAW